jgi:NAD(P)H-dependent flavin oxidoreductase YrpB (nitropropane dioxygenase family)
VRETAALTDRPFGGNFILAQDQHRRLEGEVIGHFAAGDPIVRYETAAPLAGTTGDIEALSMWAGQSVGLARQSQPAADIVAELTSGL